MFQHPFCFIGAICSKLSLKYFMKYFTGIFRAMWAEVPLFQMSELKLAAKRLDSGPGSRWDPQRSSESDYSGKASTHSGLTQHVFGKRSFPETMEKRKTSPYIEG